MKQSVRHPRWIVLVLVLVLGAFWSVNTSASTLILTPATPRLAQPSVLTVPEGPTQNSVRVIAIYRPGSPGSYREELGRLNPDGQLVWRPQQAGLVRVQLEYSDGTLSTHDVAVRFGRVSIGGVVVLLFAGIALLIGAVLGFQRGNSAS